MALDVLPVTQFFEGAGADIPPALLIIPIAVAVVFLPIIDLAVRIQSRFHR